MGPGGGEQAARACLTWSTIGINRYFTHFNSLIKHTCMYI